MLKHKHCKSKSIVVLDSLNFNHYKLSLLKLKLRRGSRSGRLYDGEHELDPDADEEHQQDEEDEDTTGMGR